MDTKVLCTRLSQKERQTLFALSVISWHPTGGASTYPRYVSFLPMVNVVLVQLLASFFLALEQCFNMCFIRVNLVYEAGRFFFCVAL